MGNHSLREDDSRNDQTKVVDLTAFKGLVINPEDKLWYQRKNLGVVVGIACAIAIVIGIAGLSSLATRTENVATPDSSSTSADAGIGEDGEGAESPSDLNSEPPVAVFPAPFVLAGGEGRPVPLVMNASLIAFFDELVVMDVPVTVENDSATIDLGIEICSTPGEYSSSRIREVFGEIEDFQIENFVMIIRSHCEVK